MAKKILVIEDEGQIAKMIKTRLRANGYRVISARDGEDGIRKVETENPDLVITDHSMKKMTGAQVVEKLKQTENLKHIPVILLSGFLQTKVQHEIHIPPDAYVPKPFEAEDLLATIKQILKE